MSGYARPLMKTLRVVAALLTRGEEIFIQKRGPAGHLPNLWEFVGGKVEGAETDIEALVRECDEELGVRVQVGAHVCQVLADGPDKKLTLDFYWAILADASAVPIPRAATEGAWVTPSALSAFSFCPADKTLVAALASGRLALGGTLTAA